MSCRQAVPDGFTSGGGPGSREPFLRLMHEQNDRIAALETARQLFRANSFTAAAKTAGSALAAGTIARRAQAGRVPCTTA